MCTPVRVCVYPFLARGENQTRRSRPTRAQDNLIVTAHTHSTFKKSVKSHYNLHPPANHRNITRTTPARATSPLAAAAATTTTARGPPAQPRPWPHHCRLPPPPHPPRPPIPTTTTTHTTRCCCPAPRSPPAPRVAPPRAAEIPRAGRWRRSTSRGAPGRGNT